MAHALAVANAFIELARRDGIVMSNMKLQKLIYFAQGHALGIKGEQLVDELPEAWPYGPVYPSVYHEFKHFGAQPITEVAERVFPDEDGCFDWPPLEGWDRKIVEAVWEGYKEETPTYLSALSHVKDGPWAKARARGLRGAPISLDDMKSFFAPQQADA